MSLSLTARQLSSPTRYSHSIDKRRARFPKFLSPCEVEYYEETDTRMQINFVFKFSRYLDFTYDSDGIETALKINGFSGSRKVIPSSSSQS
jgi:hypothetical protein